MSADDEKVHTFTGDPRWLQHRYALRWAARMITGDPDSVNEEQMATIYDQRYGGDDARVGFIMTKVVKDDPDKRAYVLRVLLATDMRAASARLLMRAASSMRSTSDLVTDRVRQDGLRAVP